MNDGLRQTFGDKRITVEARLCLNERHKRAGCAICADACPVEAIHIQETRPALDEARCINCGVCLHVCPTEAFTQPLAAEVRLLRTHFELPNDPIGLVCPLHPSPANTQAPVRRVIRHTRCLAGFGVESLLELSADGERTVWLDDAPCADCPIGHAHGVIIAEVKAANALLEALNRPPALHTHRLHAESLHEQPHQVRVIEAEQPEVSRRGLFTMWGRLARQRLEEAASAPAAPPPSASTPVSERLPHRTPPARHRLNRRLRALAASSLPAQSPPDRFLDAAIIPYGRVLIDADACSGCELCARFCPTPALQFIHPIVSSTPDPTSASTFRLDFRASLCLDCNVCVVACPEDALRMGERVSLSQLLSDEPETLLTATLTSCIRCGASTRQRPDDADPLCYVCRAAAAQPRETLRGLDLTKIIGDA